MEGLVVFLIVVLAALIIASAVLIVMAIMLTRNITRSQRNMKHINHHIDQATTIAGIASSIYGLAMKAMPKIKTKHRSEKNNMTKKRFPW